MDKNCQEIQQFRSKGNEALMEGQRVVVPKGVGSKGGW
jgi:hypothetical protein